MTSRLVRVNGRCNLACSFCDRVPAPQEENRPLAAVEAEIAALPSEVTEVRIIGGEPMLHPDIHAIARAASARARVVIETNGTRLRAGPELAALRRAGVRGLSVMVATLDIAVHRRMVDAETSPRDVLRAIAFGLRVGMEVSARLPIAEGLSAAGGRLEGLAEAFPTLGLFVLVPGVVGEAPIDEMRAAVRAADRRGRVVAIAEGASSTPVVLMFRGGGADDPLVIDGHASAVDGERGRWLVDAGIAGGALAVPDVAAAERLAALRDADATFEAVVEVSAVRLDETRAIFSALRGTPTRLSIAGFVDPRRLDALIGPWPNVRFDGYRANSGHLPPCALPDRWRTRPELWRELLARADASPNRTTPNCHECGLSERCHWTDASSIPGPALGRFAVPTRHGSVPWARAAGTLEAPAVLQRTGDDSVACTAPWTTMEIDDPDGRVHQCCSTWTIGDRGSLRESSMLEVWNGPGYQRARALMAGEGGAGVRGKLCEAECVRLHDERLHEREFRIIPGSERFVANQRLMAGEIAERRTRVESRPLFLAIAPSTYCNYDCIMCDHGRSPRRELPPRIWDEVKELLPTLRGLTLLGGEPLASPDVMTFLREFDSAQCPDTTIDLITNGSLLTAKALRHMTRCSLGSVTISLNAGTADAYAAVQRGRPLNTVIENIDALLHFRAEHHRWFGITLSFVVQPAAIDTLEAFGIIADERDLDVRLMALSVDSAQDLDFYLDPDQVARCVRRLDEFGRRFAARGDWKREAAAVRAAILGQAAARQAGGVDAERISPRHLRLPLL